jgi:hypothetical protein
MIILIAIIYFIIINQATSEKNVVYVYLCKVHNIKICF